MNRLTELEIARLKVQQATEKISILRRRKVKSRSDEFKYWKRELDDWSAYEKELSALVCRTCPTDEIELGKTVMSSGAFHIKAVCPTCGQNVKGSGQWVSKKSIPDELIEHLPVVDNYLSDEPCAVCGEKGTELHHWAPVELFGREEAEKWPQDYLCPKHHQQWHNIVTTPFRTLRKREEKRNGNEKTVIIQEGV